MEQISYETFQTMLDIRVGQVLEAERVEGTDKLVRLSVDLGAEQRQLIAGIAESYQPEALIGLKIPVLANLEPRTIRGVRSEGMILCPTGPDGKPVLLRCDRDVPAGAKVK